MTMALSTPHSRSYCLSSLAAAHKIRLPEDGRWLLHRVVRGIDLAAVPTLMPGAEHMAGILQCTHEASMVTDRPARVTMEQALRDAGALMLILDTRDRWPIPALGSAIHTGCRRWTALRRAVADADVFDAHWAGPHAALVRPLPHIQGYVQQRLIRAVGNHAIDGIAQLCFPDEATMLEAYTSPAREPLREDARAMLAASATWLVDTEQVA